MASTQHRLTLKVLSSYFLLLIVAGAVGYILYSEFKEYTKSDSQATSDQKIIETGVLINLLYETDSFSQLALLTQKDSDYENFVQKVASLYDKIEDIKTLSANNSQRRKLDSVKQLLEQKANNIEQLRFLKLTSNRDNSLDNILEEIKKLEQTMGKNSLETMVKDPSKLNKKQQNLWQSWVDYLNANTLSDTTKLSALKVDSMLVASRFIVSEAKKENSRIRRTLQKKENELIRNDLTISAQMREIISDFDTELLRTEQQEALENQATVNRTRKVIRIAGIIALFIALLFTYLIVSDFFKAEKLKKSLEKSNLIKEDILKSREQLISTVSHDLQTPLNVILGYSELISKTPLDEKQQYYFEQVKSSSKLVTKLVDDLLDYSKLEAGKLSLEYVPFSLENLILQIAEATKERYSEKSIELKVTIKESLKNNIFLGDPLRIQQILNNLIGNAYKFTSEGIIEILAIINSTNDDKKSVSISIKDSGIGISKKNLQTIFKEFTQADAAIAHQFGGSGLGLAISQKLAQMMGGSIEVASKLDQGSTFTLNIPLKISSEKSLVNSVEKQQPKSTLTALVCDDDTGMLALMAENLKQMGIVSYCFKSFSDLREALPMAFDFILTDIQMPGATGFDLISALKTQQNLGYTGQPIIAMTGDKRYTERYYIEKGFVKMIQKPFMQETIVNTINLLFPDTINTEKFEMNNIQVDPKGLYNLDLIKSFVTTEPELKDIISSFYHQAIEDHAQLEEYIVRQDYKAIENKAHKMLTMARQLKAETLVLLLEKLEQIKSSKDTQNDLERLSTKLNSEVGLLLGSLKEKIMT